MRLKKILKKRISQCSVEYIILFAIIASITLIGLGSSLAPFRHAFENMASRMFNLMH